MNKKTLTASALMAFGLFSTLSAQTQDISVIVAPSLSYTFFHKNLNLGESPAAGVRVGFGIGPLLEARALYEQSFDIKQLDNISSTRIDRIGGEIKLNLWSNTILTPYLTAGAGVMNLKYKDNMGATPEDYKEKQLYSAFGAGLKINLAKRIALSLEAKDYIFNVDANNRYLKPGVNSDKTLHNWGGQASLDFYLGGTKSSSDAVSKAYRNAFGNGFRGAKFVIEPGVAYLDFHDSSIFRDTYLLGGSAGVDFGQYIGVRGFYYQGVKNPNTLEFNFGKELELYGGNVIARLNVSRGVTPYLTLGAGYLNVKSSYEDINGANEAKSGWFALGGAGLEIPLHRMLALYGQANLMLNEQDNKSLSTITNPSDVKANWMLQAGLRFNIGKKSRSGEALYQRYAESLVERERTASNEKINTLRAEKQAKIDSLEQELALALEAQDYSSVQTIAGNITTEKKAVAEITTPEVKAQPADSVLTLTKAQLEELVAKISAKQQTATPQLTDFDRLLLLSNLRSFGAPVVYQSQPSQQVQTIQPAIDVPQLPLQATTVQTTKVDDSQVLQRQLLDRMEEMESRLNNRIDAQIQQTQPTPIVVETPLSATTTKSSYNASYLKFRTIDPLVGLGFGPATSFHIGVRPTWQMGRSRFSFAPDAFYIFSKDNGYSVAANVFYQFGRMKNPKIAPYLGAGLGFSSYADRSRGGITLSAGAKLTEVLGGNFFVDLSLRPAFSNVFLSAGYSIKL